MFASRTTASAAQKAGNAGRAEIGDVEGKQLIAACLAGSETARRQFQEQFGPLVYRFGSRFGDGSTEPGEFYLYVFEGDRLFRRLRSYRGIASLGGFLRSYILPDLHRRLRAVKRRTALDTVPLKEDDHAASTATDEATGAIRSPDRAELLSALSAEKRLLIKLLYVEDFELEPEEIRHIAEQSGRSIREVIELVEEAGESVRRRELERRRRRDQSDSAAGWILRYERRLARLAESPNDFAAGSARAQRIAHEREELERKRAWRDEQRRRARQDAERATVTLPYKDIARILNMPIGSVSAQIARLRQELRRLVIESAAGEETQS